MSPRKSAKAAEAPEMQMPQPDGAKKAVLDKAVGEILKRYGEGSIMKLGEAQNMLTTDAIPTGSLSLDIALGVGGVPRGRITEIYGPESSGKTTICQHIVAEAQKRGGVPSGSLAPCKIAQPVALPASCHLVSNLRNLWIILCGFPLT